MADNNKGKDLKQVGLPAASKKLLRELVSDTDWFEEEGDAYKCAVGISLARGWVDQGWQERPTADFDRAWRAVLLDSDGSLKKLIKIFAPECDDMPYRYSEWAAVAGINFLHEELRNKRRKLGDVLELQSSELKDISR